MLGARIRRLAFVSFALLAACGPHRNVPRLPDRIVIVDNQGFADMTVYVVEGTFRQRLGIATGASVTRLTLPRRMSSGVRRLQFICNPIGGSRTTVSQDITSGPGDTITLTIPPGGG